MGVQIAETELREKLMATNEEFRRLAAEHKSYSEQLERLTGRAYLTEQERIEEITLKKKKLMLKDQMYSMVQKYRKEIEAQ